MLKNTFCHLSGIGKITEQKLWYLGVTDWDSLNIHLDKLFGPKPLARIKDEIDLSNINYQNANITFFTERIPSNQFWRLFPDFRNYIAYIDIETTSLFIPYITTIALYDGKEIKYYINGQNLDVFLNDLMNYKIIVTYNGKCFDIPVIESYFKTTINCPHIDLRYLLKSLGYSGGLKRCECQLGINRGDLEGVDGHLAVFLWKEFKENNNLKALETLLAYNIEDVINLEKLLIIAYNHKIKGLKNIDLEKIKNPIPPEIPYKPDLATIDKVKFECSKSWLIF